MSHVSAEAQAALKKLSDGELRFVILKIKDGEVVVGKAVAQEDLALSKDDYEDSSESAFQKFQHFVLGFTFGLSDGCFGLFDFRFTAGGSKVNKIVFFYCFPATDGKTKEKMMLKESGPNVISALGSAEVVPFFVHDEGDLQYDVIYNKLSE